MHGAREGYEEFAASMAAPLMRRALLLTRDRHAAEDLVQDTFARMYEKWSRVNAVEDREGYTQQMLYRLFVTRARRRSSTEQVGLLGDVTDRAPAVPEHVALRVAVAEELATLAPQERLVLVARYLDDLSVDETARLLRRSSAWVRTTSHRAIARLRVRDGVRALLPH